ncbi:MAG: thioredoxin domain-containing protein [Patescibacteria group bacterium]|nr:thioredoxin domain-containing protein [Patescibacteria group bacterium]
MQNTINKIMPKFTKKSNFPTALFVAASLAIFILCGVFFFIIKINFINNIANQPAKQPSSTDKYYLNKNYSEGDLLITKVPELKDMLTGPIITDVDPNLGAKNAPVTIVQFSDFECDFCHEQGEILKQILNKHQAETKLIWKDYPKNNEDSISFQAAVAARCAQKQNQFWAFHNLLYQNSNNLTQLKFLNFADQLNLNRAKFVKCLDNDNIKQLIKNNIKEANALNIKGIPCIYVNDQEVIGEITIKKLSKIIEIEFKNINN